MVLRVPRTSTLLAAREPGVFQSLGHRNMKAFLWVCVGFTVENGSVKPVWLLHKNIHYPGEMRYGPRAALR